MVARYRDRPLRRYFRADAAFAKPEVYEFLEAEGYAYAIRLPTNAVLQEQIAHLLTRPVGRPPNYVRGFHASFSYQVATWSKPRRVVAKVEWHRDDLYPRVGLDLLRGSSVTKLSRPTARVTQFYNGRVTAEQHIKEGKHAINWTHLSCHSFRNNAVRLQLHALAYNLANVPIRLRQAVGFAERGCTPHPARFLGPSAPNPMKIRGFGASPQAGVGGSPQSTAHQAPNLC